MNHYPVWKNTLIVFFLFISALYALPNIYGSDLAIQISGTGDYVVQDQDVKNIKNTLDNNEIDYKSMGLVDRHIMIRFEDSTENKPLMIYDKGIDWEQGKPMKRDGPAEMVDYKPGLPLTLELEYFLDHISKPPTIADGKNGCSVVKILEQATQSMSQVQEES